MVTSNGVTNVVDTVYDAGMPVEEVGYAQGTNTPYVSAVYLRGPRRPEYRRDVVHQSVNWYMYGEGQAPYPRKSCDILGTPVGLEEAGIGVYPIGARFGQRHRLGCLWRH
ncbi:MAG TPA: hypothetical protein VKV29_07460 [Chthonomonas sp.]|uniref:hypothetical protein n=1 Tax=Chthonomonas sp. TaxID=2282153 RepID=UPI002B4B770E|nr:hypothetical protein [Chthonomonas sp.]HLH80105.1 hypothetical protein [Chthonomonas sp.]